MNIFTVSFFGHRHIDNFLLAEKHVEQIVRECISTEEYVEFLVGRDGVFDQIVSSTIVRLKREVFDGNSRHVCVLPYPKAEYRNNIEAFERYYDEVEICEESVNIYPKRAIYMRNCAMVDRSDFVVFFVEHEQGGAYQTMRYAMLQKKRLINLFSVYP